MRKYLILLFTAILCFSCSDEIPNKVKTTKQGRIVYAYLISNNVAGSLDSFLKQNICDMYEGLALSGEENSLLVYYRPYSFDQLFNGLPSILEFNFNGKNKINGKHILQGKELDISNIISQAIVHPCSSAENHVATDPATMRRVLTDMQKISPATQYGLIFGSHGTGWIEGNSVKSKSFGDDAGYNINIPELANVLKESFGDKKLDFILFDACMMGAAEVAYEVRDATRYMVASALETPVDGFPYVSILPYLYKENVDYNAVCSSFIDFNIQKKTWGTVAAVDCSKMDTLARWVKKSLPVYEPAFQTLYLPSIQQYGLRSFLNVSFDVVDVFRHLNAGTAPEELVKIMDEVVIAKDCMEISGDPSFPGVKKETFCGIGMYLPNKYYKEKWNRYYPELAWYDAVGWGHILNSK